MDCKQLEVVDNFVNFLEDLSCDENRLQAMYVIKEALCLECGRMPADGEACYCSKDE